MIQVSHEIPTALLEKSREFNDYDYCLVHLTFNKPDYQKYYIDSLAMGRKVLLDNSLFELESMFDADKFVSKIREINAINSPNFEFVVPDALHDTEATINSFENFRNTYHNLPGKSIGVVQGKTVEEMDKCYAYMSKYADKIALPFDSKAFNTYYPELDNLEAWCQGRQRYINHLITSGLWNNKKPHHLLGCSFAKEFENIRYRDISIESIDTSNPVVAGLRGLKYEEHGLYVKPSVKLHTLIDYKPNSEEIELIEYNTKAFKRLIGR